MRKLFAKGTRVLVFPEGGWRQEFLGRITTGPRTVKTLQGEDYYYDVWFDSPQDDLSDDGPYIAAEIMSQYLSPEGEK